MLPIETRVFAVSLAAGVPAVWAIGATTGAGPELPALLWFTLVALIGLPHGACDVLLARRAGFFATPARVLAFHAAYLGIALATGLAWFSDPTLALSGFLALAAWHFSLDWRTRAAPWPRALIGAGLVTWPALFNPVEVARLFGQLGVQHPAALLPLLQAIGLVSAIGIGLVWARQAKVVRLESLLLFALAALVSPLLYFLLYFCALHSIRHFREELESDHASGNSRVLRWSLIAIYTLIPAVAGLAWILDVGQGEPLLERTAVHQVVFIGLSCLTTPHLVLALIERRCSTFCPVELASHRSLSGLERRTG